MSNIIEDNDEDQFANSQSRRDLRVSSDPVLDVPHAVGAQEAHRIETIDNVGDFFRFVDRSNKSEISARGFTHAALILPRRAVPQPDCDRTGNARRPWRRSLTTIFELAGQAEGD